MAIRLVNQPVGIGGLAAYAAGAGRRRQRELKYANDLALRGQERRDRFNLLGQQRQFALEMELGRERRDALRDVMRSTERLGARKYAADLALDRDELVAKHAAEKLRLEDVAAVRKRAESATDSLDIPTWVSPTDKVELEKKKATIKAFLKPDMDLADPDVRKTFNEQLESFYSRVGSLKPPSPTDAMKEGITYRDPVSGGFSDEPGEGRQPYQRKSTGEWVPLEQPEQKAGEEYRSKVTKIADQLEKEVDEESLAPVYKTREEALDAAAKKVAADDKFFGGSEKSQQPQAQAAPAPAAGQPQITPPSSGGGGATGSWGETPQEATAARVQRAVDTFIPRPMSRQEFEQLPPGTVFIAPDGSTRRK